MKRVFFCALILAVAGGMCLAFAEPTPPSNTFIGNIDGCFLGIFREGAPQNMAFIKQFETVMQKKPAMIMWYLDYSSDFPADECRNVTKYGAVPHIVWEPWYFEDQSAIKLDNIINGQWDEYITNWARDAKTFGKTVFLRWGHEFNIEKYPWGIGNNDRDPQKYIKAYRHVHDIFTKAGAANVKWIWCFNNYPNPDENWNDYDLAYPGDAYVDWIGIDGYNWGATQTWSGWQSFTDMFRNQIREVSRKHPGKPVMIAEFGAAEDGGDKAAWVKEIPSVLKISMKQVKAIVLFDIRKECDWRINSSKKAEEAYRSILKDPYFISSPEGIDKLSPENPFTEKKTALAKKAKKPVRIDGDFAPFSAGIPIVMDSDKFLKEGKTWKGPKDLSASIYLLWDETYFYMYAKVTDNMPMVNSRTNGDIWNGDGIELTFPGCQVGFGAGDGRANKPIIWIWQKKRSPAGGEIHVSRSLDPAGYILEAKVPWKELKATPPKAGEEIAFDIAVDDADETWERKTQFVWNGDFYFYKDPGVWGILKFEN